jgi:hypothetical protein
VTTKEECHYTKIKTVTQPKWKNQKEKTKKTERWKQNSNTKKHVNTPTPFTHHHTAPNGKDKTPDSNTIHNIDKSVIPTKTPALYND